MKKLSALDRQLIRLCEALGADDILTELELRPGQPPRIVKVVRR